MPAVGVDTNDELLSLRGIVKAFPGVLANDHIDFALRKGQIHTLLGENGAGKTTLVNILYGLYTPDEGEIRINGRTAHIKQPSDALSFGIGMVHQHFMLIPIMSVTENIILGNETTKYGFINRQKAKDKIRSLAQQYHFDLDPDALVRDLPIGSQQRVEIIKALYREAEILILDEPTAVLTTQETGELFSILRSMKDEGKSIIFISHKLKEVLEISDVITVLRNGKVVGSVKPDDTDEQQLASMMVGREVILQVEKQKMIRGAAVLKVGNLRVNDQRGLCAVNGVSFEVHEGEIFGIAGVQGNGQTELIQALTGLTPFQTGKISINNNGVSGMNPREVTVLGTAHIPEDRQQYGLVLPYPVRDNLILCSYYAAPFSRHHVFDFPSITSEATRLLEEYDIKAPGIHTITDTLSGGNQQKTVVARELAREIKLLIASQPTRGLDVGSIEYIHKKIVEARDNRCAVLLVSTELDEIMSLADTVAVMYKGEIVKTIPVEEATKEKLGLLMAGIDA
ncbi:MAG: ABC transporter ATP-binding protein [Spirochaetales bacterium]|nr:ABC transporter ATP-binding protein [Spirochaetales bacterium]